MTAFRPEAAFLALYERYGALLTEHQRSVLDLYLRSDWSLAEIAEHEGTSRAAVHDIVRAVDASRCRTTRSASACSGRRSGAGARWRPWSRSWPACGVAMARLAG